MSSKTFVVIEAIDNPKGAMLVRYQAVERCEPDPEEKRLRGSRLRPSSAALSRRSGPTSRPR